MEAGGLQIIDALVNENRNLWWETSTLFPDFDRQYDCILKKQKEKAADALVNEFSGMLKELKQPGFDAESNPGLSDRVRNLLSKAGMDILDLDKKYLDIILKGGFFKTTSDFIKDARAFDETICMDDIMQAMRNVWIMNCIQILLELKVSFSPSIFAYSMLYPYTDNFLDSADIDKEEKKRVLKSLGLKLAGEAVTPLHLYEKPVFKLVDIIEEQYPRSNNPDIFHSLISIHKAQQSSLAQQNREVSPYETDILSITFKKGGTSVLADAFLVNGSLGMEHISFMFGFGILLQLADDLQDAVNDLKNGHMTIFSQTGCKWTLDNITNKLFNFTFRILDTNKSFTSEKTRDMIKLIRHSCFFLLLGAIANNSQLYSREYVKNIERYSPLSFTYMKKLYTRLIKEYNNLKNSNGGKHTEEIIASILAQ